MSVCFCSPKNIYGKRLLIRYMNTLYLDKLLNFRSKISDVIAPLITGNIHLTNLPFHANMGDGLIWRGTEDLIASTGKKVLTRSSFLSFQFNKINSQDIIILNGGGSFGDVWPVIMDFFINVIKKYPENRIILLPQSAWYDNLTEISKHSDILSAHRDLHLIARDKYSFDLFSNHFSSNNIYLTPDMAFAINPNRLRKWQNLDKKSGVLYLKRIDKEWNPATQIFIKNSVVSDWPTLTSPTYIEKCYFSLLNRTMFSIGHSIVSDSLYWPWVELSARLMILNRFLDRGAEFLSDFKYIVTTRLHVLILATLLGIETKYIDNTTKKLSAYANTWLSDFKNITPYES